MVSEQLHQVKIGFLLLQDIIQLETCKVDLLKMFPVGKLLLILIPENRVRSKTIEWIMLYQVRQLIFYDSSSPTWTFSLDCSLQCSKWPWSPYRWYQRIQARFDTCSMSRSLWVIDYDSYITFLTDSWDRTVESEDAAVKLPEPQKIHDPHWSSIKINPSAITMGNNTPKKNKTKSKSEIFDSIDASYDFYTPKKWVKMA